MGGRGNVYGPQGYYLAMTFLLSILTLIVNHVRKHLRTYLYIAAGLGLLLLLVFAFRSCGKSPRVMTEQEKQEVKEQIAAGETTKLKEKLVEIEAEEKVIEANVANAEVEKINAIADSRKKWANANISELQAEFDRRMQQ